MKVIGISGKAMHGKDTCARIAQEIAASHGILLGTWALAHPLKANVFGEADGRYSFEEVWYEKPPEVRSTLQRRGTEQGRLKYGEALWTLQSQAYVRLFSENFPIDGVIFTDVRFPNEVDFIRAGGVDVNVAFQQMFTEEMASAGWPIPGPMDVDVDPEDPVEFINKLDAEEASILRAEERTRALFGRGMALYIESDRPTLTGIAAQHASETSLDLLDKEKSFDGIIQNNLDVDFEGLREQLTPYILKLFDL